ncbi:MAG: hypothetical protein D6694_09610 [Gammaproteobacteria bacterium]|nr:MAG: hypothetical protein D6694_09610 [Gammaproteobacteria bacterium]
MTQEQRTGLEEARDHHCKAHIREKAAVLPLKQAVSNFLNQFQDGSDELLRYIGVLGIQFVKEHKRPENDLFRVLQRL